MAMKQSHSIDRRWSWSVLIGLLVALITWTSAWPMNPRRAGMHVAVHEGELSVDLRAAQIREVLAVIGEQAGLRIRVAAAANGIVDAQFTGMAVDQGLRRLLRAASLNYTLLYARGPAQEIILQEVRVFGEARGEATPSHDRTRRDRSQRAATLATPAPQEEQVEPEPTESVEEMEPDPVEAEHETEAAAD